MDQQKSALQFYNSKFLKMKQLYYSMTNLNPVYIMEHKLKPNLTALMWENTSGISWHLGTRGCSIMILWHHFQVCSWSAVGGLAVSLPHCCSFGGWPPGEEWCSCGISKLLKQEFCQGSLVVSLLCHSSFSFGGQSPGEKPGWHRWQDLTWRGCISTRRQWQLRDCSGHMPIITIPHIGKKIFIRDLQPKHTCTGILCFLQGKSYVVVFPPVLPIILL